MNRSLVISMALSVVAGGSAGALALASGWGVLAAIGLYSAGGSAALVGGCTIASLLEPREALPPAHAAPKESVAYA